MKYLIIYRDGSQRIIESVQLLLMIVEENGKSKTPFAVYELHHVHGSVEE